VPLQLRQILERVAAAQLAGVNHAHKDIAYIGAIERLISSILSVQYSSLQVALRFSR